uniref:Proteasome activator PA28 C-terminal domain-containing protein n=1 Tax=Trichuris muris TaxID=70415 RepID=A0A5S6QY92_TRIMR
MSTGSGCDAIAQMEKWKTELMAETERLVLDEFPRRVLHLNELLENGIFKATRLGEIAEPVHVEPYGERSFEKNCEALDDLYNEGGRAGLNFVFAFRGGVIASNKKLAHLISIVKPLLREAVEDVTKVRMWIVFLMPRVEDGNNFGVAIQEDILSEVRTVEVEVATFLDNITHYLLQRGYMVCSYAKKPHIEDFKYSIGDLDEQEFITIRLIVTELRNHYSNLHDVIAKNLEKLKLPRPVVVDHLY